MEKDMSILELTVKTKSATTKMNLADDLYIDPDDLNKAFCDQPAKYAWWATVACQAKTVLDSKKLAVERQEDYFKKTLIGELDSEVRQTLELNGEKITESKVTNSIYKHPRYIEEQNKYYELKEELNKAWADLSALEVARESMDQRKDALISLGAHLRASINNTDLEIKKTQYTEVLNKAAVPRRRRVED